MPKNWVVAGRPGLPGVPPVVAIPGMNIWSQSLSPTCWATNVGAGRSSRSCMWVASLASTVGVPWVTLLVTPPPQRLAAGSWSNATWACRTSAAIRPRADPAAGRRPFTFGTRIAISSARSWESTCRDWHGARRDRRRARPAVFSSALRVGLLACLGPSLPRSVVSVFNAAVTRPCGDGVRVAAAALPPTRPTAITNAASETRHRSVCVLPLILVRSTLTSGRIVAQALTHA